MIKTFEQFINENYTENTVLNYGEEYGSPLFNEISESLVTKMYEGINEGRIIIDANMIEEGLFDVIGNMFKKKSNKMAQNIKQADDEILDTKDFLKNIVDLPESGATIEDLGRYISNVEDDKKTYEKIEALCKDAIEICEKLAEKEEKMYNTIEEKMTAANEAIKDFTKMAITKINEIVEVSKNKVSDVIATVVVFCKRMAEYVEKIMQKVGEGIVLGFGASIMLTYCVYKGALKICTVLVEKVKDGAKVVKESFIRVKNTIANWVSDVLTKAKELLIKVGKSIKDGAKKAYEAIGNAYLNLVAVLGQLASDIKDNISKAYNSFVQSAKEFADDVKSYISNKWNIVSDWCKKTSSSFAKGVKNVWEKTKEKVMNVVGSAKDAYQTLKKNADATWNDIKDWNEERQQADFKARIKYAVDKWGKDEVSSWIDEL
jgi:phage-related protein